VPKSKLHKTIESAIESNPNLVVDILLASPFWLQGLSTDKVYRRESDDTDGEEQGISVAFGPDADAWVEVRSYKVHREEEDETPRPPVMHRFRTGFGGGRSQRVRTALLILAHAMELDEKDLPDPKR
jgi:hypothetical protein